MTTPIALDDDQLQAILDAAAPLPVHARDGFLQAVAAALRSCGEIGDGVVHRVCREQQRVYFSPPDLSHYVERSKYR